MKKYRSLFLIKAASFILLALSFVLVSYGSSDIKSDKDSKILRGPNYIQASYTKPSNIPASNFSGIIDASNAVKPAHFKIMRTIFADKGQSYIVQAVLLDKFGNYIKGYRTNDPSIEIVSSHSCDSPPLTSKVQAFNEVSARAGENYDIEIAIDISASSDNPSLFAHYIKEYLSRQSPDDKFMISAFNQNFSVMVPLTDPNEATWALTHTEMPRPDGLSALNKAAYLGLEELSQGDNKKKILIIITNNSDNASIIYSANDIAVLSEKTGIPVYIIGIGNALESYSLKYITAATGGRFYHIFKEDIYNLYKILDEITYAQKNHYEFDFPIQKEFAECSTLKSTVEFNTDFATVSDRINLILKPTVQSLRYQSLANFKVRDTVIAETYKDQLRFFAEVLKDNPSIPVELIGHCSINEFPKKENDLSIQRAMGVKRFLTQLGVPEDQIKVKGEGAGRPLYFLQTKKWQGFYNRRVEIKWLDPEVLPYEIIAELGYTEEFAFDAVEKWEKMGYKAYYDRYLLEKDQVYRIKLWGYASEDDAEEAAKFLSRKYKRNFYVD